MPIKLGTVNVGAPYSKIYLGTALVYKNDPFQYIDFTSSIIPTSWTQITANTNYYATNTYGRWEITASTALSSTYKVSNLFDGTTSTMYRPPTRTAGTVTIELPTGMSIQPKSVSLSISSTYVSYRVTFQGLNENGTWAPISTLEFTSSEFNSTKTFNYPNISGYYSQFRLSIPAQGMGAVYCTEFKILSGTIKKAV